MYELVFKINRKIDFENSKKPIAPIVRGLLVTFVYWSSTENNNNNAVINDPQNGNSNGNDKTNNNLVRCVRK